MIEAMPNNKQLHRTKYSLRSYFSGARGVVQCMKNIEFRYFCLVVFFLSVSFGCATNTTKLGVDECAKNRGREQ
jgi:hypothetical protein